MCHKISEYIEDYLTGDEEKYYALMEQDRQASHTEINMADDRVGDKFFANVCYRMFPPSHMNVVSIDVYDVSNQTED